MHTHRPTSPVRLPPPRTSPNASPPPVHPHFGQHGLSRLPNKVLISQRRSARRISEHIRPRPDRFHLPSMPADIATAVAPPSPPDFPALPTPHFHIPTCPQPCPHAHTPTRLAVSRLLRLAVPASPFPPCSRRLAVPAFRARHRLRQTSPHSTLPHAHMLTIMPTCPHAHTPCRSLSSPPCRSRLTVPGLPYPPSRSRLPFPPPTLPDFPALHISTCPHAHNHAHAHMPSRLAVPRLPRLAVPASPFPSCSPRLAVPAFRARHRPRRTSGRPFTDDEVFTPINHFPLLLNFHFSSHLLLFPCLVPFHTPTAMSWSHLAPPCPLSHTSPHTPHPTHALQSID